MKRLFIFSLLLPLFILSCKKDDGQSQADIDEEKIQQYVADNNIPATRDASGIYYVINETGSGGSPVLSSDVEVRYKGELLDGTVFDQTQGGATVEFPLSNLIEGWQIAIPMLQKGGDGLFIIPSALGYGSRAIGSIPANSVLVFEIELVNFN